jgi:hypothetical protein
MVPATSPLPDSEDGMLDIEPTEGSEQRRQRLAQEFFNQVRTALGEFSSLREHLVASGHSIDQLGNRLIHDENYLAAELAKQSNLTEDVALEAQVGRRHAESLEERLGIFQKSLHEAHRLRGDEITEVALESVRQATRLARLETAVEPIPRALDQINRTQNVALRTINEFAQTVNSLGQVVSEQGKWIKDWQFDLDDANISSRADAIKRGANRVARKIRGIAHKTDSLKEGSERRNYRHPTVEPASSEDEVDEDRTPLHPFRPKRTAPPVSTPAIMTGGRTAEEDLRQQIKELEKQRDFYEEIIGGGKEPPTKPPIYIRGGAPDPGDSDGSDDEGRGRRSPPKVLFPPRKPFSKQPEDPEAPHKLTTLAILDKGTPCPNPPKFKMERDEDYRPYLRGCRRFIDLQPSRFPTEQSKIRWAISFLEGDKASTWGNAYEQAMMANEGGYRNNWTVFEEALVEHCSSPFDEQRAVRQMYNWKYKGDVVAYIDKMKYYNIRAKLSGGGLRDAVISGLSRDLIKSMSMLGRARTDEELWRLLEQAGEGLEDANRQENFHSKGGEGSDGKASGKKRSHSEVEPQKNRSSGDGSKKSSGDGTKRQKQNNPGKIIQAGESTWSKKHAGIQQGLIDRRRREDKCTVCEGDHKWADCSNKPKIFSLKKKEGKKETKEKVATVNVPVPKVSSARIMEIDSDEPMSDYN